MHSEQGICRIAAPIFAVFCCQTIVFCGNTTSIEGLRTTAFLQASAMELCPFFSCHFQRKRVLSLLLAELILFLLVYSFEFLDDFGANQRIWSPSTFSCNPDVFHVSGGMRLSWFSMERELGIIVG